MAAVCVKGLIHFDTDEEAKEFCKASIINIDAVDQVTNAIRIKSTNQIFNISQLSGEKLKKYEEYCASKELQDKYRYREIEDEDIGF